MGDDSLYFLSVAALGGLTSAISMVLVTHLATKLEYIPAGVIGFVFFVVFI